MPMCTGWSLHLQPGAGFILVDLPATFSRKLLFLFLFFLTGGCKQRAKYHFFADPWGTRMCNYGLSKVGDFWDPASGPLIGRDVEMIFKRRRRRDELPPPLPSDLSAPFLKREAACATRAHSGGPLVTLSPPHKIRFSHLPQTKLHCFVRCSLEMIHFLCQGKRVEGAAVNTRRRRSCHRFLSPFPSLFYRTAGV